MTLEEKLILPSGSFSGLVVYQRAEKINVDVNTIRECDGLFGPAVAKFAETC